MLKKYTRIVLKAILWIFVAVLLVVAIKLLVGQIQGKAVFFGNSSFLRITTESMVNEEDPKNGINVGDYIVVKKIAVEDLKVGDIISFYSSDPQIEGKINTHRITNISPDFVITTKGDNNSIEDSAKVNKENVIGKYEQKLVVITTIMGFLTQNVFVFILVVGAVVLFAFVSILKSSKQLTKDDEQKKIDEEIEKIKKQGIEEYSKNLINYEVAKDVSQIENEEKN